ncbi:MAG: fumarate/nitrate reduction transcriptional regulator Fnr [Gammaproteobacteria bacterium]|nr:fumarate/nitrate reduction transcriptional regulator Fnr [Gammaproteobacteria bacterium]
MTPPTVKLSTLKTACKNCKLHQLCLPLGLENNDMEELDKIIKRAKPFQKGEYLFQHGDEFDSLFAVRSGSVKTYSQDDNGDEQITGFYLAGEMMGLDAVHEGIHPCSAIALETTSICKIPFKHLENLSSQLPSLQHQLLRIMSKEITEDQALLILLGQKSAEERVAAYLVNMSDRMEKRGFSPLEFNLSMSRKDIGNYLGLTIETISRTFSHLQQIGLINPQRKHIEIVDSEALRRLAGLPKISCGMRSTARL